MKSRHGLGVVIICFFAVWIFTGCGGGSGGGGGGGSAPPTADAGPDQNIALSAPGTITLHGSASDSGGTITSQHWQQIDGPSVTLSGADTATPTFTFDSTNSEAYTFRYTATDNNGAQSSDTVTVYAAPIVYSSAGDSNWSHWTKHDDTGASSWSVNSGQLKETANVESVNAFKGSTSYHLGSYELLDYASMNSDADYRFSVDITPLHNGDGNEGNDVGIMFRYLNSLNYYRLSMNARYGFTRLEEYSGGSFKTLAVDAIGYVDGNAMNVTVEASGDTIVIWIDGDPVFAVPNADILSGSVALYCQDKAAFNNVKISDNSLKPVVAIATPLAYSVTPNDYFTAEAVVLNGPSGDSVAFTLGNGAQRNASVAGNVYSYGFNPVTAGNHELTAQLLDATGNVVDYDVNSTVGTGGNYYITVGDSITNGQNDLPSLHQDSSDGRIVSIQGYQTQLADELTTDTSLPQIVFNEGIGGDTSEKLAGRIDSILKRHPEANKVLMLIGTNDSGVPVTASTFSTRVGTIANAIVSANKDLWIAKVLPTYTDDTLTTLDAGRNNYITQYNSAIQTIIDTDTSGSIFAGPDFYTIFNSSSYYSDHLHPNHTGYLRMADYWDQNSPTIK